MSYYNRFKNNTRSDIVVKRIVLIVFCTLFLTGCGILGGNDYGDNPNAKYFTGTDGVEAHFQGVPPRLYYYGVDDTAGNEFSFGVEVWNRGASFSRGGIYVSGFDPNMLFFQEIPIQPGGLGACGFSLGSVGFGEYGGILRCDGFEASSGGGVTNVRIKSMADLLKGIGNAAGKKWFDQKEFDLSIDYHDGPSGTEFFINVNDILGRVEYYQHGRLLIEVLRGMDFVLNKGQEFWLAGDNYEWPGGESEYYVFNGKIIDWPPGLDETQQNFLLTSCYLYTTYADPIICVDPDPYSDVRKVCAPRTRTWGGGNGAPVAITSIEQENTPRKIVFRINVANVGRGEVWDMGQLEKCSPYYPGRVTPDLKNVVWLGDVRVGSYGLEGRGGRGGIICSPNPIRLDPNTGRGTTTCTYPLEYSDLKSAYQTPLVVELWYGYSQTEQRNVQIKRVI